jgi:hypothetical protein
MNLCVMCGPNLTREASDSPARVLAYKRTQISINVTHIYKLLNIFWRYYLKVKSLCVIKHQDMKTCGGMKVHLHEFLSSAVDGGEQSALFLSRFNSGEITLVLIAEEARWAPDLV